VIDVKRKKNANRGCCIDEGMVVAMLSVSPTILLCIVSLFHIGDVVLAQLSIILA
jgi:hypothetical protein